MGSVAVVTRRISMLSKGFTRRWRTLDCTMLYVTRRAWGFGVGEGGLMEGGVRGGLKSPH